MSTDPAHNPTEIRLAMLANGYDPIAANGKKPVETDWPLKLGRSVDEIINLATQFPSANNTGFNCRRVLGFDADITDPFAADTVYSAMEDWFGNRGKILRRGGTMSKFMVPLAMDVPMPKVVRRFKAPNGSVHQIEARGDGQQSIAHGHNPDAQRDYFWANGRDLTNTPRSELPLTTEKEVGELLDYLAELLKEQFNWVPYEAVNEAPKSNGHDKSGGEHQGSVDAEAELATIHDGTSANQVQPRVIASMLRKGAHPDGVLEYVADTTVTAASRHGLDWTAAKERVFVRRRIVSAYKNLLLKDYDPSTGVIPDWLPGEFHQDWIARLQEGRKPTIGFNLGGFYVRAPKAEDTSTNADGGTTPKDSGVRANGENDDGAKERANKKSDAPKSARIVLRSFKPFDVATLPPRSWLYGKHYQRRTVSLTAGPGGMGKSSLDLVEAIAMATCRNLLGEQPEERLRVWYHNGEDPFVEIQRRVAAICQHYKIPMEELTDFLFITSGNEFPLRVAKGYANLEIDTELLRQISACIADKKIDVAVFDPLVTLHSVSEIDTGKMDTVIRLFASIADDNDAAIELAHHVRKPAAGSNGDYDVHDIRGVTAITDAVRAARLLNRMNEKDAEAAGCDEKERLSRFRVDRAKGNYSPPQAATWRQFINIELPNSDEVGVVARWNFPGQGERTPERAAADQTAEQVFLLLLDKFIARSQNVSANTGPNHAPSKFAEEQEAKKAKVSKAALKAAMNRLLDAGRIRTESTGRADRSSHRLVPWHETPQ